MVIDRDNDQNGNSTIPAGGALNDVQPGKRRPEPVSYVILVMRPVWNKSFMCLPTLDF
jgi:hypothetical protein